MDSNRTHEEALVEKARGGDREALSELVSVMKDMVYNLAIRMLGNPADADDATQEILIRLVTSLSTFRGDSALRTWVYRIASNQLLNTKTRGLEKRFESFEVLGAYLSDNLADDAPPVEEKILVNEAKLRCTSGMLLCLDREHRLAYILGEIIELDGNEGAAVLEIDPAAFRKRLSRARERMTQFMRGHCGLMDPKNPCRCSRQAAHALKAGTLDPKALAFGHHPVKAKGKIDPPQQIVEQVDELMRAAAIFRSHPDYSAPATMTDALRQLLSPSRGGLVGA